MPTAKVRAFTILGAFEQAQTELVGKAVILTNGTAGTWRTFGLTSFTDCESRSGATMESGQSQPSSSRSAAEISFDSSCSQVRHAVLALLAAGRPLFPPVLSMASRTTGAVAQPLALPDKPSIA